MHSYDSGEARSDQGQVSGVMNAPTSAQGSTFRLDDVQRELEALFRIQSETARDGMWATYQAVSVRDESQVELEVCSRRALASVAAERRLRHALAMWGGLDHPNIAGIQGYGATAQFIWFSGLPVAGNTLSALHAERGPLTLRQLVRVSQQVAAALDYAHRRGVTHGSLSAENIHVLENDWVAVRGFALGAVLNELRARSAVVASRADDPPAGRGEMPGDPMDDQHALAQIVANALSRGAVDGTPQAVPDHVRAALARALSAHPADRFSTTLQFVAALAGPDLSAAHAIQTRADSEVTDSQQLLFVQPPLRTGLLRSMMVGVLLIAVGAAGAYLLLRDEPRSIVTVVASQGDVAIGAPDAAGSPRSQPVELAIAPGATGNGAKSIPPPLEPYKSQLNPVESMAASQQGSARASADVAQSTAGRGPGGAGGARGASLQGTSGAGAAGGTGGAGRASGAATTGNGSASSAAVLPGRLFVSSYPWGRLYVDDAFVSNTPVTGFSIPAGPHRVRIVRDGFRPHEVIINVGSGADVRLIDLILIPQESR